MLNVSPKVHKEDLIYQFLFEHPGVGPDRASDHYFNDGRNSAILLRNIVARDTQINVEGNWDLLEFASGYGCVTRHFKDIIPESSVISCDIHQKAVDFIQQELQVDAVISVPEPEKLWLGREFDIVFALSFFSHMPINSWSRWLKALFRHVKPGGSLIFTTHGKESLEKLFGADVKLDKNGFWFSPSSEQLDINTSEYGTTITSEEFVTRTIFSELYSPMSFYSRGFWWGHQDAYVVYKLCA